MQLETQRLILRKWTADDVEPFVAMCAEPEVMRFLSEDGKSMSRFAAWRALCGLVGHWDLRGFGLFAVDEKATGEFVGRIGPWFPEGWPDFEIGWTLRSKFWGRGYATEAAQRCIEYGFTDLGRTHLISLIASENVRSIRVAERLGQRLEGDAVLPHMPDHPVKQYGLTREEWIRARTR